MTRSGTNALHGSLFEFHRNSALDARNFFDPPNQRKRDFYRNQFGAVAGGPIARDRTLFFGAYEGLIERLGVTGVTAVPDDNARRGLLPTGQIPVHAAIPQYIEVLFPRANGRSLGGGAADNWQLGNTLILSRGRHSARIGAPTQYLQFNQHTTSQVGDFLRGTAISVDFAVPGKIDPDRKYRQWLFGAFMQDDIRLTSRLSANAGLRYEFVTVPTEADSKISNLRNVMDPALAIGDPWHDNPSLKNFAPRLGLAWDPFGDGQTAVRGGFGIFYDEILPKYSFFSGSLNPPFTTRTSITNPPLPNVLANFNRTRTSAHRCRR